MPQETIRECDLELPGCKFGTIHVSRQGRTALSMDRLGFDEGQNARLESQVGKEDLRRKVEGS